MENNYEQFTESAFYQQREAAILGLLNANSFPQYFDLSGAIYYAGCVAGSLGLPFDSESVCFHVNVIRRHARRGRWPEIARMLSEIYVRANAVFTAGLEAELASHARRWTPAASESVSASAVAFERTADLPRDDPKARAHS